MFGAMRSLLAAERGRIGSQCYADGTGPDTWEITTKDVLEFATVEGTAACGLQDRIGPCGRASRRT